MNSDDIILNHLSVAVQTWSEGMKTSFEIRHSLLPQQTHVFVVCADPEPDEKVAALREKGALS